MWQSCSFEYLAMKMTSEGLLSQYHNTIIQFPLVLLLNLAYFYLHKSQFSIFRRVERSSSLVIAISFFLS